MLDVRGLIRFFRNAVCWGARHGWAWRPLPARFGKHETLGKRRRRWAPKGLWHRLFEAVQEPDLDGVMLDSPVVRAHAQAAGSPKKAASATKPSAAAAAG